MCFGEVTSNNKNHGRNRNRETRQDDDGDDDIYDVIIIGAGWSGLAAARKLVQHGGGGVTKLRILEARDYIGGRSITSYQFGKETPVELGSEWIHGRKKNPIQALVEKYGIPHKKIADTDLVIGSNDGHVYGEKDLRKAQKVFKEFMRYMSRRQDIDEDDTDLASIVNDFVTIRKLTPDSGMDGRLGLEFMLREEIMLEYACDLQDMSMYWWDDDEDLKGGDTYLAVDDGQNNRNGGGGACGYSALIEKFAQPVSTYIQLQSRVTSIDYQDDEGECCCCTVTFENVQQQQQQSSEQERNVVEIIKAKCVLVTLPLGVLKANTVKFSPPLPSKKQHAIDRLGISLLNKCILHWKDMKEEDIFWPKDKEWIMQVPEKEKLSRGKDEEEGSSPTCAWTEFYNPYGLNGGKPLLVGSITGRAARDMEYQTDDEIVSDALKSLRGMFGGGDKHHRVVPDPTDAIITRWGQDEYALGSYSFLKLGSRPQSRKELGKPVCNKLWFAGEATHMKYPCTTHGALLSGEHAALNILSHLGLLCKGRGGGGLRTRIGRKIGVEI